MNSRAWRRVFSTAARGLALRSAVPLSMGFVGIAYAAKKDKSEKPKTVIINEVVVRQNYSDEIEAAVNKQVNLELYASMVYLSMAAYFDRDDVALPGFAKFCKDSSEEERQHAWGFIKYQNDRGGRVVLREVPKPPKDDWGTPAEVMMEMLSLEVDNNSQLLTIHEIAHNEDDSVTASFLEHNFLTEQINSIKLISDIVTRLKLAGTGVGVLMIDKELKNVTNLHGTDPAKTN